MKIIIVDKEMIGIIRSIAIITESVDITGKKGHITGVGMQGMSIDHTGKAKVMETGQDNN